jgi:hypothetical protein
VARTRTLAELRAEVRQRADMENSELVSDAEVNRYINQSIARLYGKIASMDEGDFVQTDNVPTTIGQYVYTLNADFFRLASVPPYVVQRPIAKVLKRFSPADKPRLLIETDGHDPWNSDTGSLYYRIAGGDTIEFLPTPTKVVTIAVSYIPASPVLDDDADTFDGRNGWDEWVVLDSAVKCLTKEESDVRALIAEREALWEEIKPQAQAKDLAEPGRVRDVEGGGGFW